MARSLIQRRQKAARARVEAYEASLRRVSQPARPAPNFHKAIDEAERGFEREIVRDAEAWRPLMKTRDPARLRLAAARMFSRAIRLPSTLSRSGSTRGLGRAGRLRKSWFVVAAGGGSLYKAGAGEWLSRKEVHAFLNPLGRLGFEAAIWQAIAPVLHERSRHRAEDRAGARIAASRAPNSASSARWRASSARIRPRSRR